MKSIFRAQRATKISQKNSISSSLAKIAQGFFINRGTQNTNLIFSKINTNM